MANKPINGKQCTIAWYIDDNKLSHADPKVVDETLEMIEKYFGDIKVSRGNTHNFLGMEIEFMKDFKFLLNMKDQLEEAIKEFRDKVEGNVATLAQLHLFKVNEKSDKLQGRQKEIFH